MSKSHPKVIKSREQYREYMDEFLSLFGKNLDNDQDMKDRYELLGVVIRDYESREFPPEKPSAIDAILFEMDQQGLSRKDMIEYLGSSSKVSEVLSGKRGLSQSMIRKLHSGLGIPLDILIQDTKCLNDSDDCNVSEINEYARILKHSGDDWLNTEANLIIAQGFIMGEIIKFDTVPINFDEIDVESRIFVNIPTSSGCIKKDFNTGYYPSEDNPDTQWKKTEVRH